MVAHICCPGIIDLSSPEYASRMIKAPPCDELVGPDVEAETPHVIYPSPSDEPTTTTGRFGDVELRYGVDPAVLGRGHHALVRRCVDRYTGRRCAIKSIFKRDPAVGAAGLVAREVALLRELDHENIVELVDVYEDADYVHLVTELCEGGELFDRIVEMSAAANGTACFPEDEAAAIVRQVLEAVSYMRSRGVVHRDVKPENILFETTARDSGVKLIDFGLSRLHRRGRDRLMRTVVGTPYYIAPEVLKSRYDASCDLWSVGVIAYIMLCGYPPFNGADSDAVHRAVLRGRYYFPEEDWGNISEEAMDFISRLLQRDPRIRMTAKEALNHPWIVGHANAEESAPEEDEEGKVSRAEDEEGKATRAEDEKGRDNSSVEVMYRDAPPRKHLIGNVNSPPRGKLRLSTFGL